MVDVGRKSEIGKISCGVNWCRVIVIRHFPSQAEWGSFEIRMRSYNTQNKYIELSKQWCLTSSSVPKFDDVAELLPGKENLRIKARVVRMWRVPTFLNPAESISLEMVLIDEKVS
ncbi:replication factor-A carboxy-terminal domain protein [Trifolium pratense]|uniref:Replication factor-A carboxy-terminal domain protein n=1 Tax=Trifolium pratense TaxID=57577 RepID=A0A2K3L7C6_TRIPR|nr:replication factor-A carboxy-terminal domain protein [Trifolium pratense]